MLETPVSLLLAYRLKGSLSGFTMLSRFFPLYHVVAPVFRVLRSGFNIRTHTKVASTPS